MSPTPGSINELSRVKTSPSQDYSSIQSESQQQSQIIAQLSFDKIERMDYTPKTHNEELNERYYIAEERNDRQDQISDKEFEENEIQ